MKSHFRLPSLSPVFRLMVFFLSVAVGLSVSPVMVRAQHNPSTAGKIAVVLTTEPSPAHKGSNTVRVKLTDAAGQPIGGATVIVTFFMPAMPTMNMAAMKTVVTCTEKASGTYEGKADLASGGQWQVSILAREAGKVIATRKLTIKANGGM